MSPITTWDRRLYFPSEGRRVENFFPLKIRRFRTGLNPRTRVPEASTLTPRPPKPLYRPSLIKNSILFNCLGTVFSQCYLNKKVFNANMKLITIWWLFITLKIGICYFILTINCVPCLIMLFRRIDFVIREFLGNFNVH